MSRPDPDERECSACGESIYEHTGTELYCPVCSFCPQVHFENLPDRDPWEQFWQERRAARRKDKRPYCVGGFTGAYFGEGEYEYDGDTFLSP